jgi:hypothetical protein
MRRHRKLTIEDATTTFINRQGAYASAYVERRAEVPTSAVRCCADGADWATVLVHPGRTR